MGAVELDNQEIYELKHTTLRSGVLDDYLGKLAQLESAQTEGRTLCVLTGLIGYPPEEVLQVTRFSGIDAWQQAQSHVPDLGLAEKEEVRLMRSISSRPKELVPAEDRRAVYGYRRFFIRPNDLEEFVHCSEDGIWPRIEAQDARILGLWATLAATDPLEVGLLTGYHGPAHWEETRDTREMPPNMDRRVWETARKLGTRRRQLAIRSWVCLMRAVEVAPGG